MIIALKATPEHKDAIEALTSPPNVIRFVEDESGNYVVGKSVLTDPAFEAISSQLSALEEVVYSPKMESVEINDGNI